MARVERYRIINLYNNFALKKLIIKFTLVCSILYTFNSLSFNLIFFIIEWYLIIAIITGKLRLINAFKNRNLAKRDRRLERNIRYFLKTNKLYTQETITDENGNNSKIITNCMNIGYLCSKDYIYIRVYKDGDNYSTKANNFDVELCALLQCYLDNKIDTITHCDYVFNRFSDSRINITASDDKPYNNTTYMPLSSNLKWNILKQPHLLLAGSTGSGKTTVLNYLILEMKKMQSTVYVCDPKRSDLASLKAILGSDFVASDVNNIAKLTRIVKELMEQRFIDYKENADTFVYGHSFVDYNIAPIFLIFDELGAFRASADKKVYAETMSNLTEVILKGREMGVFAVLSTQQPNANNIPTELRDNLSVRLALGNMSSEAYRMIFGEDIKDLAPTSEVGTGYIFLDGLGWSKPKPFSAPYLDYKNFNFIEELKKYCD